MNLVLKNFLQFLFGKKKNYLKINFFFEFSRWEEISEMQTWKENFEKSIELISKDISEGIFIPVQFPRGLQNHRDEKYQKFH
jgi:hypothetical protein